MASATPQKPIRTIFATLALVMLLAALDQTIVSTALPTIAGELGGLTHLSWVVTAYLLTSTIVGPLYGKLGDLYGRKLVLQTGIVIFLVGSILSGLSQNMVQLIAFRALQGVGGGGLIVTILATVGDLIPPRERGKYQGIFAAVFGASTIIGPLIGGFFVDNLSWRWIFYVNVPLGILALIIIGAVFEAPPRRGGRTIDYAGAVLLSVSLTAIIMFTSLGGATLPWASPLMIALMLLGLAATVAFLLVERSATEAILPLSLFGNRTFTVTCGVAFIVGFSLFGSVTYLPIYLQVVKGISPTASGLQLMPMMIAMFITSIVSGRLISRWGRYKIFPVIGTALMTLGVTLLSQLEVDSWIYQTAFDAMFVGMGMGMIMQVLTMAVQNNVEYKVLGVATAGTSLFRAIGGAFGVAIFGAIFANGLHDRLAGPGMDFLFAINPTAAQHLPQGMHDEYVRAVMDSLRPVYFVATFFACIGFLLTLFIREAPLRGVALSEDLSGAFPMPRDASSVQELERIIDNLVSRENRWRNYAEVAERIGVDLKAPEIWLLYRLGERDPLTAEALSADLKIAEKDLAKPLIDLRARKLIEQDAGGALRLTDEGNLIRDRMIAARGERLREVLQRWEPDKHPEVKQQFQRLGDILSRELPVQ